MLQTINDVVGSGHRVIVYAGDEVFITWNHSLTLQAWGHVEDERYKELSIQTLADIPKDLSAAIEAAKRFYWNNQETL